MKVVRIKLRQAQANYRKHETMENKMTYPLPPLSTVIGAIHCACGYKIYHPMDISIQGSYGSLQREAYKDYAFLNSTMNDRGILIKLANGRLLSNAYDIAATANSQGANFDEEEKVSVVNRELLDEYQRLRRERSQTTERKKNTHVEKDIEKIDEEYARFATLVTSIKYYEILYDIQLIIHIHADDTTMQDIVEHAYDIKSLGRSEDFVEIEEAIMVELQDTVEDEILCQNTAYLPLTAIKEEIIVLTEKDSEVEASGTKYYLDKEYHIEKHKRIFNKKWVLYSSNYAIDDTSDLGEKYGIYYDGEYIVALM